RCPRVRAANRFFPGETHSGNRYPGREDDSTRAEDGRNDFFLASRNLRRKNGPPDIARAAALVPGRFATARPGARKANGPAGWELNCTLAELRFVELFQTADVQLSSQPTAGLKQPSLRGIVNRALERRNAAPVQTHHS